MQVAVQAMRASDAEAVELLLSREYVTRLRPSRDRSGLSISNTAVGPLSLGRARFDMVGDLHGRSQGVIGIGRLRAGHLSYATGAGEVRWSTADLFVAVDPASEYALHVDRADVEHTMIDLSVFDQVVEPAPGQELRLIGRAPVSSNAARRPGSARGAW